MKKQAYSSPQIKVIPLRMSGSLLLSTSNVNIVEGNTDIEWGGGDDSGEACASMSELDGDDYDDWD